MGIVEILEVDDVNEWLKVVAEKRGPGKMGTCVSHWDANDIAFKCRTCELDSSCVICVECFFAGAHEEHDTSMIITSGGCCDCGDLSSWSLEGCCPRHRGVLEDEYREGIERESEAIPVETQRRVSEYFTTLGAEILSAWQGLPSYRINSVTVRDLQSLKPLIAESFWLRHMVENCVMSDSVLRCCFGRTSQNFSIHRAVVALLHELVPMIGFKKRCGSIAMSMWPSLYEGTDQHVFETEKSGLGCLSVQLFTVREIAERCLEDGSLDYTLNHFVTQRRTKGAYSYILSQTLKYILTASRPEKVVRYIEQSSALLPYLQQFSLVDIQARARVHVEYELLRYEHLFQVYFSVFKGLQKYFDYMQHPLSSSAERSERINRMIDVATKALKLSSEAGHLDHVQPGVTFHFAIWRLAIASLPLDDLIRALWSWNHRMSCAVPIKTGLCHTCGLYAIDDDVCLPELEGIWNIKTLIVMIQRIVATFVHTYAIKCHFWRRNGTLILTQAMVYCVSLQCLRLDTAMLIVLLFVLPQFNKRQRGFVLGPMVNFVVNGSLEDQATQEPLPDLDATCAHRKLLDIVFNMAKDERVKQLVDTTNHFSSDSAHMRLLSLWQVLVAVVESGPRNLEFFAASRWPNKRTESCESFDTRKLPVYMAEFAWSVATSKMDSHAPEWELPFRVPRCVVTEAANVMPNSKLKLSSAGLPFLTRPNIQGFPSDVGDVESLLTEAGTRADVVGPSWELLKSYARRYRSPNVLEGRECQDYPFDHWTGKILAVSSLLYNDGLFDLVLELLDHLDCYEPLSHTDFQPAKLQNTEAEIFNWEREWFHELIACASRVICNCFIPLWCEQLRKSNSVQKDIIQKTETNIKAVTSRLECFKTRINDILINRTVKVTIERLTSLIGAISPQHHQNKQNSIASEGKKNETIRARQMDILKSYKKKQNDFVELLQQENEYLSDEEEEDDYSHTASYILVQMKANKCLNKEDMQLLEIHPKGSHVCAVCQQGPLTGDFLHLLLYVECTNLLQRMTVDPVAFGGHVNGLHRLTVPLTGCPLAEQDLPFRAPVITTCGHYVHSKCLQLRDRVGKCPSCRASSNFLLPIIPIWGLLDPPKEDTQTMPLRVEDFPFLWLPPEARRNRQGQQISLRISQETCNFKICEGSVRLTRGGETHGVTHEPDIYANLLQAIGRRLAAINTGEANPTAWPNSDDERNYQDAVQSLDTLGSSNDDVDGNPSQIIQADGGIDSDASDDFSSGTDAAGATNWNDEQRQDDIYRLDGEDRIDGGQIATITNDRADSHAHVYVRISGDRLLTNTDLLNHILGERQNAVRFTTDGQIQLTATVGHTRIRIPTPTRGLLASRLEDDDRSDEGIREPSTFEESALSHLFNALLRAPGNLAGAATLSQNGGEMTVTSIPINLAGGPIHVPGVGTLELPANINAGSVMTLPVTRRVDDPQQHPSDDESAGPGRQPDGDDVMAPVRVQRTLLLTLTPDVFGNRNFEETIRFISRGSVNRHDSPDDRGLKQTHEFNDYYSCKWQRDSLGVTWATERGTAPLFFGTYLEVLKTARHMPVTILNGQTSTKSTLYVHLIRNLILTAPQFPYLTATSSPVDWQWSTHSHSDMKSVFLQSFVRHVQENRSLDCILDFVKLQCALITVGTIHSCVLQLIRSLLLNTRREHPLLKLAEESEKFFLGGHRPSMCARHGSLECALRMAEWLGSDRFSARADKKRRTGASGWQKIAALFAGLKKWDPMCVTRDELEILAQGEKTESGCVTTLNKLIKNPPLDRMTLSVYDIFESVASTLEPDIDMFCDPPPSDLSSLPEYLHHLLKTVEHNIYQTICTPMEIVTVHILPALSETLSDFLMFVYTALSGVYRFSADQHQILNKISYPSENAFNRCRDLLSDLYGSPCELSMDSFLLKADFNADFCKALNIVWQEVINTTPVKTIPLPLMLLGSPPSASKSLEKFYRFAPSLPNDFYTLVYKNHRRACSLCHRISHLGATCLMCGMQVCSNQTDLRKHVNECYGGATAFLFPMINFAYIIWPGHHAMTTVKHKAIYKRPEGDHNSGKQAWLDQETLTQLYTQSVCSSLARFCSRTE